MNSCTLYIHKIKLNVNLLERKLHFSLKVKSILLIIFTYQIFKN